MDCLRKQAEKIPILDAFEKRMNIRKEYALLGISFLCLVIIMTTSLGPLVTSTIGIIVPLQETLVILRQVNPKKEEGKHMLVFWMVFGILTSLDAYSTTVISLIPLWYTIKFFFLLWAGPLRFHGGIIIYDNILARIPESWYREECGIENAVRKATDAVKTVAESELSKKDVIESNKKTD
ncbi:putative membrane traffic regulatory protein [Encephalitozoon intestinalis ATCC 50506]|uniref:Membrane traffic regulatory protein n=1 Tax=Encephalitozoon intestinalis (strain ATCC 50506) TaxID=876142 RepID=E0S991_ENCIT|nr:putative membrane traffic regulatory protein [Encephalitozoon intestinalis ATCC 50506]ADM12326.1 putative membrane traffic regulatory protein [Encephalitozoon intestinalis ATCC 50506]UTX46138.1 HVA22-like protein [Encephalitozoon intestinalis]